MAKSQKIGFVIITLIMGILLICLVATMARANDHEQEFLPIIYNGSGIIGEPWTPGPTMQTRATPTLAPTMCPELWDQGYCNPTPTPYVICLPQPCDD